MKWILFAVGILFLVPGKAQEKVDSIRLMKDISTLSSDAYQGRRVGTAGSRMAQFYIIKRFQEIGLSGYHSTYEYPFYFDLGGKNIMGTNLYGYIPGTSATADEEAYVISAHYDHLGIAKDKNGQDSIYNGADDNASGVGGLLAIAKYFKTHPPKHTMIFLAADAEEEGLKGAQEFVKRPPVKRILMDFNMDMIAHNDKNELYVCGVKVQPFLKQVVDAAAKKATVNLIQGHDDPDGPAADNWIKQSDQGAFYEQKIPFLYFGVEDHPDYHQVSDEYGRINNSFYYRSVNTILEVIKLIDVSQKD
ncbi:M20/M25/M40 family metallo-hydrolase [Chitinophaga sp. Cy-1792]|uniref:M20/M25/M40 family metallo-hydrolase n=1 Tax=Chitinophaga sp. Cy-1792 TaxID=2608339 RepID=UPI0014243EE0|nr:M20/M25/M40 family metallo-hydrolase [Chitinophaga sp. Cy-1792]NIG52384.1 M28 family peptidase [Chitinophaga sp. Cy-1792]